MQIAELCGKEHKHVLSDIDALVAEIDSAENSAEWDNVIIEQKVRKSKRGDVSLRKAASILGVPHTTLQYYLDNVLSRTIKADTEQGLSSEMFAFSVQYFSLDARNPTGHQCRHPTKRFSCCGG